MLVLIRLFIDSFGDLKLEVALSRTLKRLYRYLSMMEDNLVMFHPGDDAISLNGGCILVDHDDFSGVHIAASFLSKDFEMVTRSPLPVITYNGSFEEVDGRQCIIVGTIESSRKIQELMHSGKLNVDEIRGCWESFVMTMVDNPMENVQKALVIAGSDKRGTIYGVFTLSEQIGVSP